MWQIGRRCRWYDSFHRQNLARILRFERMLCRVSHHRACGQGVRRLVAPYRLSCQLDCLRCANEVTMWIVWSSPSCHVCRSLHCLGQDQAAAEEGLPRKQKNVNSLVSCRCHQAAVRRAPNAAEHQLVCGSAPEQLQREMSIWLNEVTSQWLLQQQQPLY